MDPTRLDTYCSDIKTLFNEREVTAIERINVLIHLLAGCLGMMDRPARLSAIKHLRKLSAIYGQLQGNGRT